MYNKQLFYDSFKGSRPKLLFDFVSLQSNWFSFDELFSHIKQSGSKDRDVTRDILYFVKIGFLLADPVKGLKENDDFVPISQKPVEYKPLLGDY